MSSNGIDELSGGGIPDDMRLNVVLIGPPGSGKGTQAVRIAQRYAIPHISTGDTLRKAVRDGTPLGLQVADTLRSGGLVGDDLMTDLVRARLAEADVRSGFVLDGFPRTIAQAEALDAMVSVPLVVVLLVAADDEIVRRLGKRRVCRACAITQSVLVDSDEQLDPCPYCGGQLVRRQDDHPETVRHRLAMYASFAEPIIGFYRVRPSFGSVDGLQHPEDVTAALQTHIEAVR